MEESSSWQIVIDTCKLFSLAIWALQFLDCSKNVYRDAPSETRIYCLETAKYWPVKVSDSCVPVRTF